TAAPPPDPRPGHRPSTGARSSGERRACAAYQALVREPEERARGSRVRRERRGASGSAWRCLSEKVTSCRPPEEPFGVGAETRIGPGVPLPAAPGQHSRQDQIDDLRTSQQPQLATDRALEELKRGGEAPGGPADDGGLSLRRGQLLGVEADEIEQR